MWTTARETVVTAVTPDATNTVYVWARDAVGGIGSAAGASVAVLTPDGDFDRDGLPTWQENVSGTDPTSGNSVFSLAGCAPNVVGYNTVIRTNTETWGELPGQREGDVITSRYGVVSGSVLTWHSVTGRYYNVYTRPNASGADILIGTNVPATPPLNVYTDGVDTVGRFYRIGVTKP